MENYGKKKIKDLIRSINNNADGYDEKLYQNRIQFR